MSSAYARVGPWANQGNMLGKTRGCFGFSAPGDGYLPDTVLDATGILRFPHPLNFGNTK